MRSHRRTARDRALLLGSAVGLVLGAAVACSRAHEPPPAIDAASTTPPDVSEVDAAGEHDAVAEASTPRRIQCGSTQCVAPDQTCCIDGNDGGETCAPTGSCTFALTCDDRNDCAAGEVCCFTSWGTSACRSACDENGQMCATSDECVDAGPCDVRPCYVQSFRLCGRSPRCE